MVSKSVTVGRFFPAGSLNPADGNFRQPAAPRGFLLPAEIFRNFMEAADPLELVPDLYLTRSGVTVRPRSNPRSD